jgi:large subunit ribosomal protein L1
VSEACVCVSVTTADVSQVGAEDLVNTIKAGGALNFDRVIGHPSVMPILSQIARILGPKGLMPNPKVRGVNL